MKKTNPSMVTPTPGSDKAVRQGCLCPVWDNYRGLGRIMSDEKEPLFWVNGNCPMHGSTAKSVED